MGTRASRGLAPRRQGLSRAAGRGHAAGGRDARSVGARWLLDAGSDLAGRRIGPAELRELRNAEARPWLTSLVSTEAALTHGPVMLNLAERRVNEAREIAQHEGDLLGSALAARDDLPM